MKIKSGLLTFFYHFIFAITSSVVGALFASWPLLVVFVIVQKTNRTVNLSLGQVMANYNQLLKYLVCPFDKKLVMSNFRTSPMAAQHFAEVKRLFILAIVAFLCCLTIHFFVKHKNSKALKLNKVSALLLLVLPIVVLPFALANFDQFFVTFHHLFFAGSNTWLFDPETDPIINVLTEGFFAACFAVWGIIYELYFADQLLQR
ncbi:MULTISPECIES: TIGR01906 family membrane protein [unclassified Lactobacillus]|uniref:TIGR01906 family membrane protein n=1 Tax=unclassified Lactobacillus TaxID=2620435 RepID=UPI000EFA887E|nr:MULTISPECIES: TIGR01906 family membrane protein [unclassified Lactobacillus]RMC25546.1 TIGR01906 family membrane protein [Lactobacillus sp. ESL0247]RMC29450.1 TIGR01906 family membrane protein [Lactobacillus sp. ESL0246]RMC33179.1 TIGR01906 family membrane protein [Lactobacillus sp. ESL0245]